MGLAFNYCVRCVAWARNLLDAGPGSHITVITSDRTLAERARQRGARVTGAGTFLARLVETGC